MEHLIKALKKAYRKSNTNIWSRAGGCFVCSRMNLAAVGGGAGLQFLSAAGVWWRSPKPPFCRSHFPSSGEGHPSALVGVFWEQRRGAQWINKTSSVPRYPWKGPRLTGGQNKGQPHFWVLSFLFTASLIFWAHGQGPGFSSRALPSSQLSCTLTFPQQRCSLLWPHPTSEALIKTLSHLHPSVVGQLFLST